MRSFFLAMVREAGLIDHIGNDQTDPNAPPSQGKYPELRIGSEPQETVGQLIFIFVFK